MTAETMPLLVTTGVGVGVLAGVLSGVFYLLSNGVGIGRRFKFAKSINRGLNIENNNLPQCCSCDILTQSVCSICNLPLCKDCNASNKPDTIFCLSCISQRNCYFDYLNRESSFFAKLLNETTNFSFWSANQSNLNQVKVSRHPSGGKLQDSKKKLDEKGTQVRDYLQQMAENLAGGSMDQVSVSRMYPHPEYLPVIDSESINNAQAKLQQLVQRVIEEALRLPALLDYSGLHRDDKGKLPDFNPKTYEDLLATAILNKVIDRYQQEALINGKGGASSSGVHSGSSSPAGGGREVHRRSRGSRARLFDSSPDRSSLEPASHDDYDHSDSSGRATDRPKLIRKYSGNRKVHSSDDEDTFAHYDNPVDGALSNINFNKKNRIFFPEFGGDIIEIQDCTDKDNTSFHSEDIYTNNNSWEENWLFQKKKIKTTQSVSVPMLIPSSNTDCRAMIGDKEVDDTSDLSDAASEEEDNTSGNIKHVLVDSKTIIGGKNSVLALMEKTDDNHNQTKDIIIVTNETDPILTTNGHVDENDNVNLINVEEKSLQETNEIVETVTETFVLKSNDEIPEIKSEKPYRPTESKNAMRDFLKSLESDDSDGCYGIAEYSSMVSSPPEVFEEKVVNEATNLDVVDNKENENQDSLGSHQQESEYTETITKPVQRHMDSLRRQHNIKTKPKEIIEPNVEENEDEQCTIPVPAIRKINLVNSQEISMPETIPGTIADREHKKWLNAVPMENNPYSPEAIQNRLSKKNHSSMFDIVTASSASDLDAKENSETTASPVKISPKPLQEVFSENISEYKRYGRDYYINESKKATGGRKKLAEMKFEQSSISNDLEAVTPFNSCETENKDEYFIIPDIIKVSKSEICTSTPSKENESFENFNGVTKSDDISFTEKCENKNVIEETYHIKQIIIEDVESDFDDIYQQSLKIENGNHDIYPSSVDTKDQNTLKMLHQTNGNIVPNSESLDQTDSYNSSIDDCPRIYNIQSGQIVHTLSSYNTKEPSMFRSHEDLVLPSSIKSWKSMNDVCWEYKNDKNAHKLDIRIDENLELPSVKDLAKKFFVREKLDQPIVKPKRRISRELLDNDLVNKSLSNGHHQVKLPMHMHSLTARSISKEFRDELRMSMPVNKIIHPGGAKPNGISEPISEGIDSRPESPIPEPGSLKNKLAFFENISKT